MSEHPYIVYPHTARAVEAGQLADVVNMCYINEPRQVSFGVIDYVPGWAIATHHHRTWEVIIVDKSSPGPGFTWFDGCWWRAEPGCGVFLPRGVPHAWSAGNRQGFKMLWLYGGSHEEAGRLFDVDPRSFKAITSEEERAAQIWSTTVR